MDVLKSFFCNIGYCAESEKLHTAQLFWYSKNHRLCLPMVCKVKHEIGEETSSFPRAGSIRNHFNIRFYNDLQNQSWIIINYSQP